MVANGKVCMGLDIGTTKVRAVVAQWIDEQMRLLAVASSPSMGIVRANIIDIEKMANAIENTVQQLFQSGHFKIDSLNVNIAGRHTKSMIVHANLTKEVARSEFTQEDLNHLIEDTKSNLMSQDDAIIDIIPKEYIVDYGEILKNPIGISGSNIEGAFHVIKMQSNALNNLRKCVQRAKLKIDNLIFSPLASSIAVLTKEEREAGVCLVDIGASMIGIAIYHHGNLQYTMAMPFGGDAITKDLAQAFLLMDSQAEALKIQFGSAYEDSSKNEIITVSGMRNHAEKEVFLPLVDRVIEARMEENIQFVYQEIVKAGFQNKLPAGVVITGGGAKLRKVDKLFSYITGYETRIGYPYESLAGDEKDFPDIDFATCIGLAWATYKPIVDAKKYDKNQGKQMGVFEKKQKKEGFWSFLKNIFR